MPHKHQSFLWLLFAAGAVICSGCAPTSNSSDSRDEACGDGEVCGAGQTCVDGECLDVCSESSQCPDGCCIGDVCSPCKSTGISCESGDECATGTCQDSVCVLASCGDGTLNGNETDVDCGGDCGGCEPGEGCTVPSDCVSGVCQDKQCLAPTCLDGVRNGDEDCDDGAESASCDADCTFAECGDGYVNAQAGEVCDAEGDTEDCDGDCTPVKCRDNYHNAAAGEECDDGNDIDDDACSNQCFAATCSDGKRNGDEIGVDCGGDCGLCDQGDMCNVDADCASGHCTADGVCDYLSSCLELLAKDPDAPSGAYTLDVDGPQGRLPFDVYCDMETAGGGWTLTLNLDTSDGHTMWWANPLWVDQSLYGSAAEPFASDHKSAAWNRFSGATSVLLAVHQQGSRVGWKTFHKADGKTLYELMQQGDNTLLADSVIQQSTRNIWHREWLVRRSTQLFANHCFQHNGEHCVRSSSAAPSANGGPDGDRIGSHESSPDKDNAGGGLGNWHDMGYCCNEEGTIANHTCNDYSFRTASEAQAGWAECYGGQQGYFGSDTYVSSPGSCTSQSCEAGSSANYAAPSGYDYDYALFLRDEACHDEEKNGNETSKDCGGVCRGCPVGSGCVRNSDCLSGHCGDDGLCTADYKLSCQDLLYAHPELPDGVYKVDPRGEGENGAFPVYCDMTTRGGGWTVVEKSPYADAIGVALFNSAARNKNTPEARQHRLLERDMDSLKQDADELLIHCGGRDYIKTDAQNLFQGQQELSNGLDGCDNRNILHYEEASLKGNTLEDVRLCTWFLGANRCAGAFHIDEHKQSSCGLKNHPWNDGNAITDSDTDAFAPGPETRDPSTNCHEPGAVRYVMLRGRCVENGVQDGTETGVDCGGACPGCEIGQPCGSGNDCKSGVCTAGGECGAPLTSCDAIWNAENGANEDGYYTIDVDGASQPDGSGSTAPYEVYCDMTQDGGWTRLVYEQFESNDDARGWSGVTQVSSCGIYGQILGGYNVLGQTTEISKSYAVDAVSHEHARVELDFIKIDSWDSEEATVEVESASGPKVIFNQTLGGPGGEICGNPSSPGWTEQIYPIEAEFAHTADSLEISARADLSSAASDESWGLDNLAIFVR